MPPAWRRRLAVPPGARQAIDLFLHYYRRHWPRLLFYALVTSLQSLFVLPVLYLVRTVFDHAIPQARIDWLCGLGAAIVLVRLLQGLVGLWLRSMVIDILKGAVQALRRDLLDRQFVLAREHFSRADLDRVHTRIVLDSERFDQLSNLLLSSLLPALFSGRRCWRRCCT